MAHAVQQTETTLSLLLTKKINKFLNREVPTQMRCYNSVVVTLLSPLTSKVGGRSSDKTVSFSRYSKFWPSSGGGRGRYMNVTTVFWLLSFMVRFRDWYFSDWNAAVKVTWLVGHVGFMRSTVRTYWVHFLLLKTCVMANQNFV